MADSTAGEMLRDSTCPHCGGTAMGIVLAHGETRITFTCGFTTIELSPATPEQPADRRCGCGPSVTQIECPYHGGAL